MAAETHSRTGTLHLARTRPARRRAFALFAVIAVAAVLAVLGTVVMVTLAGDNDQARIERVADVLKHFSTELNDGTGSPNVGQSFFSNVNKYPLNLDELWFPLVFGSAPRCDGSQIANGNLGVAKWRGPYHLIPLVAGGPHPIAPGFSASNQLFRISAADAGIEMLNVDLADAKLLELYMDRNGKSDGTGPLITYAPTGGSSPVTVRYHAITAGC